MTQRKKSVQRQWYRMDLHLHTPASADYKQPNVTFFDFLTRAEEKNLDILAFTDHNTVSGYARFLAEVESLEMLERLKRLREDERKQLEGYRRLREKILILPGFEFTATLGFHILAIFRPETTVRELEHLMLSLHVPPDKLDRGSGEVGATTDVLTAYRMINEASGLVIAAHANSSHGVAMPGFDFGGQTRISYTQDPNLHALEVTDLESKSRRRTAAFFSGTKPEYPRRMHCIQGSDAHKLDFDPKFKNEMGVADRVTEIFLDEISFDAIKAVFLSNDFSRTRPYRPATAEPFDPIREAREHGDTLVQAFHARLTEKRGIARPILEDVVALANTNGGTIYIGASANAHQPVAGVDRPDHAIADLRAAIAKDVTPPLEVQVEVLKSQGKNILQVIVPRGSEVPYVLEESYIHVRSESETGLAVRDEIIQLVRDTLMVELAAAAPAPATETPKAVSAEAKAKMPTPAMPLAAPPPHTGVEIIAAVPRKGVWYYSVCDLRNNHIVHNVTLKSARRLWQYAIAEREKNPPDPSTLTWSGDIAKIKAYRRGGKVRYDLALRAGDQLHIYYGVTDDGVHGPWRHLIEGETGVEVEIPELPEGEPRDEISVPSETLVPPAGAGIAAEYGETESVMAEPVQEVPEAETPAELPFSPPQIPEEEIPLEAYVEEPVPSVEESEVQAELAPEPEIPEEVVPPQQEAIPPQEAPAPLSEEPATAPLGQGPASGAIVPAPQSAPVPKSRAQEWREELDRALAQARAAREAAAPQPTKPKEQTENPSGES